MNWPRKQKRGSTLGRPSRLGHPGRPGGRAWRLAAFLSLFALAGCNAGASLSSSGPAGKPNPPAPRPDKVFAQGQILPANGLIRLTATPGDIVDSLSVKVGDAVVAGQELVTMRSFKLHAARVEALRSRCRDAQQQMANAIEQARLGLAAAEAKLAQVPLQTQSLDRQAGILKLTGKQVAASEDVYKRLAAIADDPITSNFVGTLQLEQQRLAIDEAELKYRQQAENLAQAKDAASLNGVAADQQWQAAKLALQAAEHSLAPSALEAELKALELQQQSAIVTAPQDALVVAVNSRVGEAAAQFPLIELADITQVICDAEVVESDAALIEPSQTVTISSPALSHPLRGRVLRRGSLVGRPQLARADPLAKVDYRSVQVTIEIDPADVPIASQWLQLQVNVEIAIEPPNAPPHRSAGDTAPQL